MHIIGLTGGSGTGKSTVRAYLCQLGAGAVDADAVYRQLCMENKEMLQRLQAAFGAVLTEDGQLDRSALAKIVFSDAEKLKQLNTITIPYIEQASMQAIEAQKEKAIVLYDAPTLFETGLDRICKAVIGVLALRETRIERIMQRDDLSKAAACARIDAQPHDDFYEKKCRWILRNDGDIKTLYTQTEAVFEQLLHL